VNDTKSKGIVLDVAVPSRALSYQVRIATGALDSLGPRVKRVRATAKRVVIISDDNVMPLYGQRARESLRAEDFEVDEIVIPAGEKSKNPQTLISIVERLVATGLSRRDVVVALGGGVVGDIAGLAAALFMRGVAFVNCPTSLLSQVDASVGGKVAVDLSVGKNLLGAFHFPSTVLIDPSVLTTLSDEEFGCGLAEMLKHGALFSAEHFDQLVEVADQMYARDPVVLSQMIATSVALKAACVSRDPLERAGPGKGRVLLNLGHTFGHAIEAASGYEVRHGEAVAIGLRAAARLSERRELCDPGLEARIVAALEKLRLPTDLDGWLTPDRERAVKRGLGHDKKRAGSAVTYIVLADIGEPRTISLPAHEILALLRPQTGG
jgi:3-dehydroquinate synthase